MGNRKHQPWHNIANGKMDKEVQAKFEKAQRLAVDTGMAATLTVEITVHPQRKGEPEYIPVSYSSKLKEPVKKSKIIDLVMDQVAGVAIDEAEEHPVQERLLGGEQ